MKMSMKLFESEENQMKIREQCVTIARQKRMSIREIAREMGLNDMTVARFLRKEKDVDFKSLCIISDFVLKYEQKI